MIQKFVYKRATMEDIDELVRTRIIVLRAANKLPDDEDMFVVEKESYAYYRRALETGEHIRIKSGYKKLDIKNLKMQRSKYHS